MKKQPYLKICEILKLQKFKEIFKINPKCSKFEIFLPHINEVYIHDVLKKKVVAIIKENIRKLKWIFSYDLNCLIIFINRTWNLQGSRIVSRIHIYSKKRNKKTCHLLGQL